MSKQQQIQIQPQQRKQETEHADAPTMNKTIAKLWFQSEES